ncbi:MAG TPA: alpha/beta hydrolase [Ideonella sp.]|nr:alpha/beta hydrolase [Ideonella sp.]
MKVAVQGREAYAYTGGKPFDPALPCVVLIHGALNDHSVWALQSRALAHHGHAVLAVDLPGHGRSAGPAPGDVESAAGWVVALLDALGVRRAALVGHSMGSLIALEAAARLGERATALVLVGTAFPMKVSPALLDTALARPREAIDLVTDWSISSLASKPSAPGPGSWLHGSLRALMRRLQAGYQRAGHGNLFHQDFVACDRYAGGMAAAAAVRCPALFVLGSRDAMTRPSAAAGLREALGAREVVLPSGHALMSETPDAVRRALQDFLHAA